MQRVIILGAERDYHAQHMLRACLNKGVEALLFDTSQYPQQHAISYLPDTGTGMLHLDGQNVAFEQIQSVFWSSLWPTHKQATPVPQHSLIAYHDAYTMLRSFLHYDQCNWVNSWRGYDFHRIKPRQLSLARLLGAHIPASYIGNDPQQARSFIEAHKQVVFKPVYGGAHAALVNQELVGMDHLCSVLKQSPVTLQEYIAGTNVRTYCIGEHVFSAEITSDNIDFRQDINACTQGVDTSDAVAQLSRSITRQFDLAWSAIDWRKTPDGHFYFLEANPSPMFIHFEQTTQYPITECLLELLLCETPLNTLWTTNQQQGVNKSCLTSLA